VNNHTHKSLSDVAAIVALIVVGIIGAFWPILCLAGFAPIMTLHYANLERMQDSPLQAGTRLFLRRPDPVK
jgi:hypothetical protein